MMSSKILFHQSMRIYLRNDLAKYHPNPISNDGALGFLKNIAPTRRRTTTTTRGVIWGQFFIQNGC